MDTTYSYRELARLCAIAEPARAGDRRHPDLGAPQKAMALRRSVGTGVMGLEVRDFPKGRELAISPGPAHILLLVVVRRNAVLLTEDGICELSPGNMFLVADGKKGTVRWADQSRGLYLSIPRADLQARASAILAEPRRLAAINLRLSNPSRLIRHLCLPDWLGDDVRFAANVLRLPIGAEASKALLTELIEELKEAAPFINRFR